MWHHPSKNVKQAFRTVSLGVLLTAAGYNTPLQAMEYQGRLLVLDENNFQAHVFDLHEEAVVESFPITQSMASNFGSSLARTSDGRFAMVVQRTGHFAPANDPSTNVIHVIDGGLTIEDHGDHYGGFREPPRLLPYRLGHGGGQFGYFRPIHVLAHDGFVSIHFDGSFDADDQYRQSNARVLVYGNDDLQSQVRPQPHLDLNLGEYLHGGAVPFHEDLFLVTVDAPDASLGGLAYSTLPRGVATVNAAGEEQQDFREHCPRLHGETVSGPYVAFGCNQSPADNDNPAYTGPFINERSGILLLTHDGGSPGSFEAAEVKYPDDGSDNTSGTLYGGMGPSEGIIIANYGSDHHDGDYFLKIRGDKVEDGTSRGTSLVAVSGAAADYGIEPADSNFPDGQGRFIVLTHAGEIHIFDLTKRTGDELVATTPQVVDDFGEDCPDAGCPSLTLAPGFAYVSDPANAMVHEVSLDNATVTRSFDLSPYEAAPTQLAVFGWFGLDKPLYEE